MTGAAFLLRCLRDQELGHVFLVPGVHIDPLVAELGKGEGPRPVVASHEERAGFMADCCARVSGRFGVCIRIGGPGAATSCPPPSRLSRTARASC
jgi:acetolactate synthase-1/2/3 large subunit